MQAAVEIAQAQVKPSATERPRAQIRKVTASLKVVVLVEDNPGDARLMRDMVAEHGERAPSVTHVETIGELEEHVARSTVDLILLDLGLPDATGLDAVKRARAAAPRAALVVLTGMDDENLALQALQEGAQDYLIKGEVDARGLLRAMGYAVERKIMEDKLFDEKEVAQVTLNSIGDGVICTDVLGNITFLNLAAEAITGWSGQEASGRPAQDVIRILDADTRQPLRNLMGEVVRQDKAASLPPSSILVRRDGSEVAVEDSVAPIHDRNGRTSGAVIVFRDVSAARTMAAQMAYSAQHDFLTGLPNRMLLNDRVGQSIAFAARHGEKVAVLFLDLDGFKHINDSLGHPAGDKLLQSVAERLVGCVRSADTVSRQGGDEFVVLLSEVQQLADAAITARRMLRAVADVHSVDHHDLHITASIGISVYPDDSDDAEALIKNADTAMYQAKEKGKQGYQFFKPAMNVRAVERQSIEEGLRRALENQEFNLLFQPKVDLKTGSISGCEALIRWIHPTRGTLLPTQFIEIAEDCGLILPIGAWVIREVCNQARTWIAAGLPPVRVALNVSAMEFRDENFLDGLFAVLEETGLDPRCLELEITESVLMKRAGSAASMLRRLRAKGVQIALDDFGTGYSSLSYLRKFPVDSLKIDQSFIRQISTEGEDTAIVAAVIAMARSLKLGVVAEGVESLEELTFLRAHQCDTAQGYFFSPPVLPHYFARMLKASIVDPISRHGASLRTAS